MVEESDKRGGEIGVWVESPESGNESYIDVKKRVTYDRPDRVTTFFDKIPLFKWLQVSTEYTIGFCMKHECLRSRRYLRSLCQLT